MDDHEVYIQEPESLTVGKLNLVVRALREALYQQKLLTQAARDAVARQAFAAACQRCSVGHRAHLLKGDGWPEEWVHDTDDDGLELCNANPQRLALDPDGRLAGALGKGDADAD